MRVWWIQRGVSLWLGVNGQRSCILVYLPLCTYINPLWGMNEYKGIVLSQSLSDQLSFSLSVPLCWTPLGGGWSHSRHHPPPRNAYQHISRHCHHHPREPFLSSSSPSSLSSLLSTLTPKLQQVALVAILVLKKSTTCATQFICTASAFSCSWVSAHFIIAPAPLCSRLPWPDPENSISSTNLFQKDTCQQNKMGI